MNKLKLTILLYLGAGLAQTSVAETIWHCSRIKDPTAIHASNKSTLNSFNIASMSNNADVIEISVRDLIDVYSGKSVRVSGEPLSACFLVGDNKMSTEALTALGLKSSVIQAIARKSAIVQAQLYWVSDEDDMERCIAKHFPAVGYLSNMISNESIDSCF